MKLKYSIQIGIIIFYKKLLTLHVTVSFLDITRNSTWYITRLPNWSYNTQKFSLGESILLAQTKEYTL